MKKESIESNMNTKDLVLRVCNEKLKKFNHINFSSLRRNFAPTTLFVTEIQCTHYNDM